jgi:transaldolase
MTTRLHTLRQHGQSPWIDFLSRRWLTDGGLDRAIEVGVTGITSNPTILAAAIADGDAYDEQLRELLDEVSDSDEVFLRLVQRDVQRACDLLRPVFDRAGPDRDGWVSLEVDPRLADDTEATIAQAHRLRAMVDRPNLFVKIPGTPAGIRAVEECIAAGIPVNVTLLFSLGRHREAGEAYLRGLERRLETGDDLASVASVASFFVSRVDTEADRRLEQLRAPADLSGRLAIANARLAYRNYQGQFSGPRWQRLAEAGATPQRCLWASTSTKNPRLRDVRYVEELIGPGTVNTMPPATIEAFLDHGEVADTLELDLDGAEQTMTSLAEVGVDYDDVVAALESEGVAAFQASYAGLIDGVAAKRDTLAALR